MSKILERLIQEISYLTSLNHLAREESFSLMKKDFHHIFEMVPNLTDLTWDFLLCPFKDFIDEHCQSIKQMTLFSDSFKENGKRDEIAKVMYNGSSSNS